MPIIYLNFIFANMLKCTTITKSYRHGGSYESFLSKIMVRFALGGVCRWRAKVVLHHAKMVISTLAAQSGRYMVFFCNLTYCRMINAYWGDVVEYLQWHFYCTYWSVKTLYLTNGKYLSMGIDLLQRDEKLLKGLVQCNTFHLKQHLQIQYKSP